MKKYLGIFLSVAILLCSVFIGVNFADVDANTPSDTYSISVSVTEQNGFMGGAVSCDTVQYINKGEEATVSAVPYYGNGFKGWYNGGALVSTELNYTFVPTESVELKAEFDIRNFVENGDAEVESGHSALTDGINNAEVKYDTNYCGQASVVTTDGLLNTSEKFGNYALKLVPNSSTNAAKVKDLVNIPLKVEKNTDYILRFSYKYDDNIENYDKSRLHYIHLALNGADSSGKIQYNDTDHTIKWTYHSHTSGTEIGDTVGAFKNTWAWGGYNGYLNDNSSLIDKFISDNGTTNENKWQDVYLLFNPGEDADVFRNGEQGTIYVSLGTHYNTVDYLLIDNLSLSKAEKNSVSSVTATSGGGVTAHTYRTGENYYVYTSGARGSAAAFTNRDTNNVYYPSIYEEFSATANEGSSFVGWFDENNNCVSTAPVAYLLMTGKQYTAKFAKGLSCEGGGYISNNEDGTYTAHAYYGNKFLGWYDGTVTPYVHKTNEKTITKADHLGYVAMFTSENLITDGDFETNGETAKIYNDYSDYNSTYAGTCSIVPTCVPGSGPQFGDYCLQITPSSTSHAAMRKGLLNIPVELEAGKRYLWKFSYAVITGNYNASNDYLTFSVDTATANGKIPWDAYAENVGMVDYSFHAQLSTATEINKSDWAWGNYLPTPYAYSDNKNISGGNVWVDMYVVIDAAKSETHYLTLGCFESQQNAYVFDNMSLTEVSENPASITTVTAGENGKIYSYRTDEAAYKTTLPKGTANLYETGVATDKSLYSDMYVDYFAEPNIGFVFDGWYNTADNSLVSSDAVIRVKNISADSIEARFKADTNKYSVSATIENNGAFGGYVTGEKEYNSISSGESVSFTVVPYRGNKFLGWFDGSKCVSTDVTVEYTVRRNATLVAKFENNNLFADSGFENTALASEATDWTVSATVVGNEAFDGKHSLMVSPLGALFRHNDFTVDKNKEYYLSFVWKSSDNSLDYVKILNSANEEIAVSDAPIAATGEWQKFDLNFNSGDNTTIKLEIKYSSETANIYLDNLVLYDLATMPLDITASVEKENGIFGGYISGDKTFSVDFGTEVTVKAVAYEKNVFLGWYDGGNCVSTDAEYTFEAKAFQDLVAKFEIKNLWPDSGYENTEPDVSLSENGGWSVNQKLHDEFGFDVTVTDDGEIRSGKQMLSALHRNNTFSTVISGLKENTNYFLTFRVRTHKTLENCFFQYAKLIGTTDLAVLGTGFGTANGGQWELIMVPFESGKNTEIKVELSYSAGEGACYFDDFALFESNNIGVYAGDGGTVSSTLNGGENGPAVTGTSVTVTATPEDGNTFLGWYDYMNSTVLLSSENPYTFTVTDTQHIFAKFAGENVEPENKIVDGDFENGCFQGFKFSGRYATDNCDFCNYQVTKAASGIAPVSGDYMLKLIANSRNSNIIVNNLSPFTDYTVSFYWLGNEYIDFGMVAALRYKTEYEGWLTQEDQGATHLQNNLFQCTPIQRRMVAEEYVNIQGFGDGRAWRKVEFAFNSGNRTQAIIQINYSRNGGTDGIYFDNFKVTEGSHYSDSIVNGGFEEANTDKGWQGDYTVISDNGNKVGASDKAMYNGVNMEPVKGYKVSFKAKSDAAAEIVYGLAQSGNTTLKNNARIEAMTNVSYDTAQLTNEWKTYTLYFQSIGYKQGNIVFESLNGAQFMIDDVEFAPADRLVEVNELTFEDTEEKYIVNAAYASTLGKDHADQRNPEWYEYSDVAHSGTGSLLMKYNSEYESHELSQPWAGLCLDSGRAYEVSFWAKAEKAGTKFLSGISRVTKEWKPECFKEHIFTLDSTEWTKFTYTVVTDDLWYAGNTKVQFIVNGIENETTCDIYFDDIFIKECADSIVNANADKLYTEDVSQNYFSNYSFEKEDALTAPYVKEGDASLGNKFVTVNAGDKIVIPVSTRTDYNLAYNCIYTFAADVRGKDAEGFVGLSYSADGKELMCDSDGNPISLSVNTNGAWKRAGFSFSGNRNETEYLVIECTKGSFDVDYVALFNAEHEFAEYAYNTSKGPSKEELEYADMSEETKQNYFEGVIEDLPEGSKIILRGNTDYECEFDYFGHFFIGNIENGEYLVYVLPGEETAATLWGDVTFKDGTYNGLATTRLEGSAINITGTGVENGFVKITDADTGYAYLSITDENGEFSVYMLDCEWEFDGVTNSPDKILNSGYKAEEFMFNSEQKEAQPSVKTVLLAFDGEKGECR